MVALNDIVPATPLVNEGGFPATGVSAIDAGMPSNTTLIVFATFGTIVATVSASESERPCSSCSST